MGDLSYQKTSRPGYQQGSLSRVYKEASNMLEGYCEKKILKSQKRIIFRLQFFLKIWKDSEKSLLLFYTPVCDSF